MTWNQAAERLYTKWKKEMKIKYPNYIIQQWDDAPQDLKDVWKQVALGVAYMGRDLALQNLCDHQTYFEEE